MYVLLPFYHYQAMNSDNKKSWRQPASFEVKHIFACYLNSSRRHEWISTPLIRPLLFLFLLSLSCMTDTDVMIRSSNTENIYDFHPDYTTENRSFLTTTSLAVGKLVMRTWYVSFVYVLHERLYFVWTEVVDNRKKNISSQDTEMPDYRHNR